MDNVLIRHTSNKLNNKLMVIGLGVVPLVYKHTQQNIFKIITLIKVLSTVPRKNHAVTMQRVINDVFFVLVKSAIIFYVDHLQELP